MEHLLWVETHRPQTIADCILPERLKKPFQEYVNQNNIQKISWVNLNLPYVNFYLHMQTTKSW